MFPSTNDSDIHYQTTLSDIVLKINKDACHDDIEKYQWMTILSHVSKYKNIQMLFSNTNLLRMSCYVCHSQSPVLSSFMTYHRIFDLTDGTGGSSPAYPSGAHEVTRGFEQCISIFSLHMYKCIVDSCFSFRLLFSFGHGIVLFWLPLWYSQTFLDDVTITIE